MRKAVNKVWMLAIVASAAVLVPGCDGGGVADIVFAALQLAFGIVEVAT